MSRQELRRLADVLEAFEHRTLDETGVRRISGGFAHADMFDYDDAYVDIRLKWGVQSDCENQVHAGQYKLLRRRLDAEWTGVQAALDAVEDVN